MLGYHPQVILAGRRINDGMGKFIAEQTIKQMIASGSYVKGARVNVLGLTFKENCADLRNSKVVDIIHELKSFGVEVFVHDPQARPARGDARIYGVELCTWDDAAARRRDRGSGRAPRVPGTDDRRHLPQARPRRLLRRREVRLRRKPARGRGRARLAPLRPIGPIKEKHPRCRSPTT